MSRANIYIRKENEEAWDKIENKSDWVNEKLAGVSVSGSEVDYPTRAVDEQQPAVEIVSFPKKQDLCKEHGVPKDTCKLMKHDK